MDCKETSKIYWSLYEQAGACTAWCAAKSSGQRRSKGHTGPLVVIKGGKVKQRHRQMEALLRVVHLDRAQI